MRGAVIHGALLVVMLVYGYRTWTRDKTVKPDLGSVVLWDKGEAELVSLELKSDTKIVKLERRGQGGDVYWWGIETTIERRKKAPELKPPQPKPGEGSAAGSASAAGSGSAAGSASPPPPPVVAEEEVRKSHEFPVGEAGDTVIKAYTKARALRDLGPPTEEQKKDYKLQEATSTLTVTFKDGVRTFVVGGSVYGGSDRYAADQQSKRAYVLSKDLIANLEVGESVLHLADARGFDPLRIESVTIEADGKSKTAGRVQTGLEGQKIKTWGDPATKKPDQTIANFIDNAGNLRPTSYETHLKVADLTQVLKLTYRDIRGSQLGTLVLYKHQKATELPAGTELDPANPPPMDTEYVIVTEKTRVPGIVRKDTAQRTEQDIATVFGEHPTSIEPKGNPLGNMPLPPRDPHGGHGEPAAPPPGGAGTPPAMPPAGGATPPSGGAGTPPPGKAGTPTPGGAGTPPAKADAPKGDAPKPGTPPAKTDAPKPPAAPPGAAAPAKADAPKAPASAPTPKPAPATTNR